MDLTNEKTHVLLLMIKFLLSNLLLSGIMTLNAATTPLYDIPLKNIDGEATSLGQYKGKVILLVNVASKCGYTKQYKPLEAVYKKYADKGLVIIGAPSNDFGGQEPGTPQEIVTFCSTTYGVTFPLLEKCGVRANANQSPLYAALSGKEAAFPGEVKWNFTKFLIGRNGKVIARFASGDEPDSKQVIEAIEKALAASK